jgi:hypothetical protein
MIGAAVELERALLDSPVKLFISALLAVLLFSACGAPSSKPSTGGATDDFGGLMPGCTEEREVELDAHIESLGYSPQEVVDAFGGSQTFRIAWVPNCSTASCDFRENPDDRDRCELDESQLPSFAGRQSEITVTVRPTGAPAVAIVPGPAESADTCGSAVNVAVNVTLESDDGTVDATVLGDLGPFDIEHVQLNVGGYVANLGGKLMEELPEGSVVNATIEASPRGSYAHFWIFIPDSQRPGRHQLLLEGLMLPDKECMTPLQGSIQAAG